MKRIAIVLFGVVLLSVGCKKINSLTQFDIATTDSLTIPANSLVGLPLELTSPNMTFNTSQEFQNYNTNASLIKSIFVKQMQLTIIQPPSQDFSFLKSIQISLYTPSLGATLIAYKDTIPPNPGQQLNLNVSGTDIQS
ncbi:MAG: hypothetical protein ACYCOO_10150, partial [Chitinophagaceae bacterium]